MSYRCVKELKADAATIPVGTVIDDDECAESIDKAYVTFSVGDYHYAVYVDVFREHFEEVGE